jgi:serine/threonine-protein kinase
MADEIAVDSFLNLLSQSELISDDQLLALMAEFRGDGMRPKNSRDLANELVRREILTAWQADMLLQKKNRGFRLGQYRILKPLGQGGMSKVFLAEHETMRRLSAIKILPSKYEGDADLLNRFRLEAIAVARLDHPNIVRAWDFNKDVRYGKEIHYLAMEYVDGLDLRRMVEEYGPLDYRTAADCIAQAAEGLAHAHSAGFVHRDIKPANLLVDSHGVLKVLDLGLALFTLDAAEGSQSAVGTADYAAPEQVMDSQNVDCRADIYGLGFTFYFLLTGRRPFPKSTVMEILTAHQTEKAEPVSKFRPDVPRELEAIIDKMTAKLPLQRYQTAKDVAEKLRAWLRESESGRTSYSRISALMAEAARAKQSSVDGTAPAASKATDRKDFEFATLNDEPSASSSSVAAKSSASAVKKAGLAATVEAKDPNRQTVARKLTAPVAKRPTTKLAKSPSGRLLPDDLISALPLPEALSPASGSLPHMGLRQAQPESALKRLLKSPWCWVGLGGAVGLALLVVLVVALSPSSPERIVEPVDQTESPAPGSDQVAQPSNSNSASASQSPTSASPLPPTVSPPTVSPPTVSLPTVSLPTAQPAGATLGVPAGSPAAASASPVAQDGKSPAAGTDKPPPAAELSVDKALAGLTKIVLDPVVQSNMSLVRFYPAVGPAAIVAAERLGWQVAEKAPAVLAIDLKANDNAASPNVMLLLELTYTTPDGKHMTLWKGSKQILAVDLSVVTTLNEKPYQKTAAKNTATLFKQFVSDVLAARSRAGAK